MLEIYPWWDAIRTLLGEEFAVIWHILAATGMVSIFTSMLSQIKQITGKSSVSALIKAIKSSSKGSLHSTIEQLKALVKLILEQAKQKAALYTRSRAEKRPRKTKTSKKWHATSSKVILKQANQQVIGKAKSQLQSVKSVIKVNRSSSKGSKKKLVTMVSTFFKPPCTKKITDSAKGSIIGKKAARSSVKGQVKVSV